jgi:hypothetical protein
MACFNQEEIPECPYSNAENENNSEDCDEDAAEKLTCLELTNNGCDERDGEFAESKGYFRGRN